MILVDTSAWVEFDRATGSAVHLRLRHLIGACGGPGSPDAVAVTEPVIAEVLMGARSDPAEHQLRRLLDSFALLPFVAASDFDGAVRIYRRCRRSGVTPRGLVDCMVAAVAMRHGARLLAQDADIRRIAGVMHLRLDP